MKKRIEDYINTWEERCYSNGIPDEAPLRLAQLNKVPSYKKIAIAILNNDYQLKSLGMEVKVSNYYHELKRIELAARKDGKPKQLKLFK